MCLNGSGQTDLALYEGLAGFRFALRKFLAFSEVVTREAGVTPWRYQAMLAIRTHPVGAVVNSLIRCCCSITAPCSLSIGYVRLGSRNTSAKDRRSVLNC